MSIIISEPWSVKSWDTLIILVLAVLVRTFILRPISTVYNCSMLTKNSVGTSKIQYVKLIGEGKNNYNCITNCVPFSVSIFWLAVSLEEWLDFFLAGKLCVFHFPSISSLSLISTFSSSSTLVWRVRCNWIYLICKSTCAVNFHGYNTSCIRVFL